MSYQPEEGAFSDAKEQDNLLKNRYPDILPCEYYKIYLYKNDWLLQLVNVCRPRLRTDGINSDYINASFVDVRRKRERIITIFTNPFSPGLQDEECLHCDTGTSPQYCV